MKETNKAASVVASGETIDIDRLYRRHNTHLLRFVQRYTRSLEDAEDVVQMTFIEAMRCADRFCGMSKPSTWLFGIALNLARSQMRRNYSDRFEEVEETFLDELIDERSDPAIQVELHEVAGKIDSLLDGFSPKIRATFEAVLGGETTYEEAAEHLQIPIGTVRSRVFRVRAAVRAECAA